MYQPPHCEAAHDRLWSDIRARLGRGPAALNRSTDLWRIWTAPDLLLSQTCGLPIAMGLHEQVRLVGAPDYAIPGCKPGEYRSHIMVRKSDPRQTLAAFDGAALAFNSADSQSGWGSAVTTAAAAGIRLRPALETGAHVASAHAVAEGRADIAFIDVHTWRLIGKGSVMETLHAIGQSAPTPATPYITAKANDPAPIAAAMAGAIAAISPADRAILHLQGIAQIPLSAYLALPIPPAP
ncbi:PhnD/SsuA/transferrin family substrate-binding protein [Alphaproteobacteria bacterium KMM 3653]|uniref:PhnD/SsuA/transferrin family substrate-binding protein n=2 Tax=Harenicola maris TaxID=2841044 RepID=A0AAP2CRN2_9RHOB|nr:PhnD/SsuA/transferrin family substrate-binding protein [Harenicola maris]